MLDWKAFIKVKAGPFPYLCRIFNAHPLSNMVVKMSTFSSSETNLQTQTRAEILDTSHSHGLQ